MAEPEMLWELKRYLSIRMAHDAHGLQDGRIVYISNVLGVPSPWVWDGSPTGPDPLVLDDVRTSAMAPSPTSGWIVLSQDVGGTERHQLVAVHVDSREQRVLTSEPKFIHRFGAFFPDGEHFTVAANRRNGTDFELYVGDLAGGPLVPVQVDGQEQMVGTWSAPAVWPDGRALLVVHTLSPSHQRVYRLDLDPQRPGYQGRLTELSPPDPAAYRSLQLLGDQVVGASNRDAEYFRLVALDAPGAVRVLAAFDGDVETVAVSRGGRLAFSVNRAGLSEIRVARDDPAVSTVVPAPAGVVGALRWDADGRGLVFDQASATSPMDVYHWTDAGSVLPVTRSYRAGLTAAQMVAPELVSIPSFDGLEVPAWLYLPQGTEPAPVIIAVHGGPESQARPGFSALYQYWLAAGIAVLAPNVRGSTGYGRTYEHLDDVGLREHAIRDLGAVGNWAARHPRLDPHRIVVYGGSYGGYMVMAGLTWFPDLFCAGVEIVGIVNLESFLERTSPWRRALREAEYGSLAHDRETLRALSPIHRIDQVRVPLFVGHGVNDPRVPYEEATQVVEALAARGIPHQLLSMADEGHGAVRWQNQLKLYSAVQQFLHEHVGVPAR